MVTNNAFAQAGASITYFTAQVGISLSFAKNIVPGLGSTPAAHGLGQATADIKTTISGVAQAQAKLNAVDYPRFGQALGHIWSVRVTQIATEVVYRDDAAAARVTQIAVEVLRQSGNRQFGQAQAYIRSNLSFGQAQAAITGLVYAQAQGKINAFDYPRFGQSNADILRTSDAFAQSNADIKATYQQWAQAQAQVAQSVASVFGQSLSIIVRNNYQRMIIAYGPIDYWPFDETSGTIAADFFGHHDGTNQSATINQGGIAGAVGGRSYLFDGSSSEVYTDTTLTISETAYTLEAWFKTTSAQSARGILGRWNSTGAYISYTSPTQIQLIHGSNASDWPTFTVASGALADNNWHHVVGTFDGTSAKIYIDAVLGDTKTVSAQGTPLALPFEIGTYNQQASGIFNGYIDEPAYYNYALAASDVLVHYRTGLATQSFGQSQAKINAVGYPRHAQALATIFATSNKFAQANADILATNQKYGQAQAFIIRTVFGQAQAKINAFDFPQVGNAQASILSIQTKCAQAKATIKVTQQGYGQAQARIIFSAFAQAQAKINAFDYVRCGNAQGSILRPTFTYQVFAQAEGQIRPRNKVVAQAQADIRVFGRNVYGQAQGYIGVRYATGQAQAFITTVNNRFAQAQALIGTQVFAQAQALLNRAFGLGQAQATIQANRFGQAQGRIYAFDVPRFGQALAEIALRSWQPGQAQGDIRKDYWAFAQARAFVGITLVYGTSRAMITPSIAVYASAQAQSHMLGKYRAVGNAQCFIDRSIRYANAQASINQAGPGKLVVFNKYILPGYFIEEDITSSTRVNIVGIPYKDEPFMEMEGLENKSIHIKMLVVESTYKLNKEQLFLATTMLRSNRDGWSTLTTFTNNYYYLVKTRSVDFNQPATAHRSEYEVTFEAKPWRYGSEHTLTGTTQITTNQVGRTLNDGTWTPAAITVTGTNVTISGYTATNQTGYVTISGTVNNLIIDTDNYYSNRNDLLNPDYSLYIGPGPTTFDIIGATACVIKYRNRWEL